MEKGWIAKRSKSNTLGMLSVVPTDDGKQFNLSDEGSYREGLVHISQQGITVHSARSLASNDTPTLNSPSSTRSSTSAKRANSNEDVRFELSRNDFELMEIIGKGSCGYVKKARHKRTNELMALKVINVFEEEKRKQMMQEVIMMCDAHHDCLIQFHGAFYNEGTISVALEYMTAGSVADVLKLSGSMPEEILAIMAEQILDGMAFMHSKKQVHRDFKPCNLLMDHSGRVKITDFGVSAELDSSLVKCTTFVGTFLYMSPERFGSEPYSFPSDIWSFGLTMIECATAEYPYQQNGGGKTYWELMDAIVKNDAPQLPSGSAFSSAFRDLTEACLQKDPKLRPTATKLLTHEFIKNTCDGLSVASKRATLAKWLGNVRSCYVSSNLPDSAKFSPHEAASTFMSFYLSYFASPRREILWSLYTKEAVLKISETRVVGRDAIVHELKSLQFDLALDGEQDWRSNGRLVSLSS
uniref:mitogen-activated protein kinase kinase n=1 Tax=Guillardia theta TaxID=55529 RepID=A0A7S4NVV6_GUITH